MPAHSPPRIRIAEGLRRVWTAAESLSKLMIHGACDSMYGSKARGGLKLSDFLADELAVVVVDLCVKEEDMDVGDGE